MPISIAGLEYPLAEVDERRNAIYFANSDSDALSNGAARQATLLDTREPLSSEYGVEPALRQMLQIDAKMRLFMGHCRPPGAIDARLLARLNCYLQSNFGADIERKEWLAAGICASLAALCWLTYIRPGAGSANYTSRVAVVYRIVVECSI